MGRDLQEVHRLVLEALNARVREGRVSERQLARTAGYSQPHIHNVLHGRRGLRPATADALLSAASISLDEVLGGMQREGRSEVGAVAVPRLEGGLGAGRRFPRLPRRPRVRRFPSSVLAGLDELLLTEIAKSDESMFPWLWPGDDVLLDTSLERRRRPRLESIYALDIDGVGYVARCRRIGGRLLMVTDSDAGGARPPRWTDVEEEAITSVVRGCIVWVGRRLDRRHIYLANASFQSDPDGR